MATALPLKTRRTHPSQVILYTKGTRRYAVLERMPSDIVQRPLLKKLWINRLRESKLYTVLNHDDGLDIQVL